MVFGLTTQEVWDEVSAYISEVIIPTCQSDDILTNKLEQLVLQVERDLTEERDITPRLTVLSTVLNSHSYYENSALKRATDSERKAVRELGVKIEFLLQTTRQQPHLIPVKEVIQSVSLQKRGGDVRDLYQPLKTR